MNGILLSTMNILLTSSGGRDHMSGADDFQSGGSIVNSGWHERWDFSLIGDTIKDVFSDIWDFLCTAYVPIGDFRPTIAQFIIFVIVLCLIIRFIRIILN